MSGAELMEPPAPAEAGEVDARLLPRWMVAMTLALPMPPAKVLAQMELEHVDGLPPDWEDAPSWEEPGEVDVELLPRWMRAGLERGPPQGRRPRPGPDRRS